MQGMLRKDMSQEFERMYTPEERYRARIEFASYATERMEGLVRGASQEIIERAVKDVMDEYRRKRS